MNGAKFSAGPAQSALPGNGEGICEFNGGFGTQKKKERTFKGGRSLKRDEPSVRL